MLTLETEGGIIQYAPGGRIRGHCGWTLEKQPKTAALRLFWYTEGRGTQDVGVIDEIELPTTLSHQQDFSFTLPEGPYSFCGSLVALRWAIELVLNKGRDVQRLVLIVSPWRDEILLTKFEGDPR